MDLPKVFLDTDVIVNWLIKENETESELPLWNAPHHIIQLIENDKISGMISLTTVMEIRFLLRRKKAYDRNQIEDDIAKLTSTLDVIIPDEISLLKANSLQTDHHLDPFDAIHLATALGTSPVTLVSRDRDFISIAKTFVPAMLPEEFLNQLPT